MCVIAYAKPGVNIMDETIQKMFERNHDGAGIMWKPLDGGDVQIRKGFMKVEDLLTAWADVPTECEKAIHCRIATSGKVSAECCHPFPVRPYTAQMKLAIDHAPIVMMHNGVFSFCTPKGGMLCDYSDTMQFAAEYIYPMRDCLDIEAVRKLLEQVSTSRLLILRNNGEAIRLGDWEEKDGVYFSNLNHEPKQYTSLGTWKSYGSTYTYSGYSYLDGKYHSKITGGTYDTWKGMNEAEILYQEQQKATENTVAKEDELSIAYEQVSKQDTESSTTEDVPPVYRYKVVVDIADYYDYAIDAYKDCKEVDDDQMEYIFGDIQDALSYDYEDAFYMNPAITLYYDGCPEIDTNKLEATLFMSSDVKYKTKTVRKFFENTMRVISVERVDDSYTAKETLPQPTVEIKEAV